MSKFADRDSITAAILQLLNADYTDEDLHQAKVTWWKNFRKTGGYGLTHAGSKAFDVAQIEYQEFNNGPINYLKNMGLDLVLDNKMYVPYYFYSDQKQQKIRVYDSRISLLIALYEDINSYLQTLDKRK